MRALSLSLSNTHSLLLAHSCEAFGSGPFGNRDALSCVRTTPDPFWARAATKKKIQKRILCPCVLLLSLFHTHTHTYARALAEIGGMGVLFFFKFYFYFFGRRVVRFVSLSPLKQKSTPPSGKEEALCVWLCALRGRALKRRLHTHARTTLPRIHALPLSLSLSLSLSGPSSFGGSRSTLITVVTHLNAHLIQTHTRMDGRAQAQHCRTGWHTRACLIVGEVDYLFLFFCVFAPCVVDRCLHTFSAAGVLFGTLFFLFSFCV